MIPPITINLTKSKESINEFNKRLEKHFEQLLIKKKIRERNIKIEKLLEELDKHDI